MAANRCACFATGGGSSCPNSALKVSTKRCAAAHSSGSIRHTAIALLGTYVGTIAVVAKRREGPTERYRTAGNTAVSLKRRSQPRFKIHCDRRQSIHVLFWYPNCPSTRSY